MSKQTLLYANISSIKNLTFDLFVLPTASIIGSCEFVQPLNLLKHGLIYSVQDTKTVGKSGCCLQAVMISIENKAYGKVKTKHWPTYFPKVSGWTSVGSSNSRLQLHQRWSHLFPLDIILTDLYSVKHAIIPVLGGNRNQVPDNPVTTLNDLRIYRHKALLILTVHNMYEILSQI
jgi:hypothetical protein